MFMVSCFAPLSSTYLQPLRPSDVRLTRLYAIYGGKSCIAAFFRLISITSRPVACPVAPCGACVSWLLWSLYTMIIVMSSAIIYFFRFFYFDSSIIIATNIYFVQFCAFGRDPGSVSSRYPVGDMVRRPGAELALSPPKKIKKPLTLPS